MGLLKKVPWGIIAGACAMVAVFATTAFVGLYIILGGVAAQTNEVLGLFDEWYQSLLFAVAIICFAVMVVSIVMYVLKKLGKFDVAVSGKEENAE